MTEYFELTVTCVEAAKLVVDKTKKAVKAREQIDKLLSKLEASKGIIQSAEKLYKKLSPEEQKMLLVRDAETNKNKNVIVKACKDYQDVLNRIRENFDMSKESRGIRGTSIRIVKSCYWVIRESSILGSIAEVDDQVALIRDALSVLTAIDARDTAQAVACIKDMAHRWDESMNASQFFEIVERLPLDIDGSDLELKHHNIQQNPRDWVLEEDAFKAWLEDTQSPGRRWFWVLGDAGTGKSHIATYLIEQLSCLDFRGQLPSYEEAITQGAAGRMEVGEGDDRAFHADLESVSVVGTAYYFCRFDAGDSQNTSRILRTLLRQLVSQLWSASPRKAAEYARSLAELTDFQGSSQTTTTVYSVFDEITKSFDRVYIVIDALDEMPSCDDLLEKLKSMSAPNVKVAVTSRLGLSEIPNRLKAHLLDAGNNLATMRAFVDGDLKRVVSDEDPGSITLGPLPSLIGNPEKRQELVDKIARTADGNLLAANLLIRALHSANDDEAFESALGSLSGNLSGLIEGAMQRIESQSDRHKAKLGKLALQWVVYARGSSLKIIELQQALALSMHADVSEKGRFPRQVIVEATRHFLTLEKDSGIVSVHKAVRDFCIDANRGDVYFENAQAEIALTCLTCLSKSVDSAWTQKEWANAVNELPFLGYAAVNWGWHFAKANEQLLCNGSQPGFNLQRLIKRRAFLDTVTIAIQPELKSLGVWRREFWGLLCNGKKFPISTMHILAYFNLHQTAGQWLSTQPDNESRFETLGPGSKEDCSALYLASIRGHCDMVMCLLENGADPTQPSGPNGLTPLQAVADRDQEKVVKCLLSFDSEMAEIMVAQKYPRGLIPLGRACGSIDSPGNPEIVRSILKVMRRMDNRRQLLLNRGGHMGLSALHRAAEGNSPEILDMLLDFPGCGEKLLELRMKGKWDGTPLLRAAWASHKQPASVIKRLLERGADPHARNCMGRNALMSAAALEGEADRTKTECFEALLPYSDHLAKNKRGKTVLHFACEHGRPYHVEVLLKWLENEGFSDKVRWLLNEKDNGGFAPIMLAAQGDDGPPQRVLKNKCVALLIPAMGEHLSRSDAKMLFEELIKHQSDDKPDTFKVLLNVHSDLINETFTKGDQGDSSISLFRKAVRAGNGAAVRAIFDKYGPAIVRLNTPDPSTGLSPLAEAASLGRYAVVKILINYGADINTNSTPSVDPSTLYRCIMLSREDINNLIWVRDPNILRPDRDGLGAKLAGAASARNPIWRLWRSKGLVGPEKNATGGDNMGKVEEVQCLHALKENLTAAVVGDEQTEKQFRIKHPNPGNEQGESSGDDQRNILDRLGANGVYLESDPVPENTQLPLSRLHLRVSGRDQGWSLWKDNHPEHQGTWNGSDSWFEVGIKRDGKIIMQREFTRNRLNIGDWSTYHVIWDIDEGPLFFDGNADDASPLTRGKIRGHSRFLRNGEAQSFVAELKPGDSLCILPKCAHLGWENWINRAEIWGFYETWK